MAGTFPDVPGPRIAYDKLGGVLRFNANSYNQTFPAGQVTSSSVTDPAVLALANNEAEDYFSWPGIAFTGFGSNSYIGVPEIMLELPYAADLTGAFISMRTRDGETMGTSWTIQVLRNSVWETAATGANANTVLPNYRGNIKSWSVLTNCSAVRCSPPFGSSLPVQVRAFHVYGTRTNNDRLVMWNATTNVALTGAALDFGDVLKGTTYTKTFRIKNAHATKTANSIVLTAESLTGDMDDGIQYSIGGGAYSSSLDIGNLASGVISDVITMRRVVPSNEVSGIKAARVVATPTSWT